MNTNQIPGTVFPAGDTGTTNPGQGGAIPSGPARLFILLHTPASVEACVRAIMGTAARYHWRHDRTGRAARVPANDHFDPDAYFARINAALAWSMMGED